MATMTPGVLASFVHVDAATDAIRALKAQGHTDLTVYTPAPNHEIEEVLDHPVSPVRLRGGLQYGACAPDTAARCPSCCCSRSCWASPSSAWW